MAYDTKNSILWSNEHGPRGGDEINRIVKGKNYGWPIVSHGKEYWGPFDVGEAKANQAWKMPSNFISHRSRRARSTSAVARVAR